MREGVLHGSHVGEAAAGAHDGHVRAGAAAEEVEPRVALGRVGAPLLLGVDVVEDLPSRGYVRAQAVDHVHRGLRVGPHVPGVAEIAQRVAAPVPVLRREEQPRSIGEHRVVDHIGHTRAFRYHLNRHFFPLTGLLRRSPRPCAAAKAHEQQRRREADELAHAGVSPKRAQRRHAPRRRW